MKTIRGGKGLGDALYVQAICRHLVAKGAKLCAATSYPEVFSQLNVEVMPFTRTGIDILAHYSMRKPCETRQWQDVCITAGLKDEPVELKLDWAPVSDIGDTIKKMANGRRIIAVQLPRVPMDRKDTFGAEILPNCNRIQKIIDHARSRGCFIVQIGSGRALYAFTGIDADLTNKTTVTELLDVATAADAFLGYVSFIVPLAECLDKPALLVWSQRGLKATHPYVRQIKPEKVLEKPTSRFVFDDADDVQLVMAANAAIL